MSKKLFLSSMFKNYSNNANKGKNLDIGFNFIQNKDLINDPPKNSFRTNIFSINNEARLMGKINRKLNLNEYYII